MSVLKVKENIYATSITVHELGSMQTTNARIVSRSLLYFYELIAVRCAGNFFCFFFFFWYLKRIWIVRRSLLTKLSSRRRVQRT